MLILIQNVRKAEGVSKKTNQPYNGYWVKPLMRGESIYFTPEKDLFLSSDKLVGVVPEVGMVLDVSFNFGSDRVNSIDFLNDGPNRFLEDFARRYNISLEK